MFNMRDIVLEIIRELDERDKVRERVLSLSRDVVRYSGFAIRSMQRGKMDDAEENLRKAKKCLEEMVSVAERYVDFIFKGFASTAFQEYAEACLLHSFMKGERMPSPKELNVPNVSYLMALGDFVGELRRSVLISMKEKRFGDAERAVNLMEEIYLSMMLIDHPEVIALGFKHKCDVARSLLEKTRAEFLLVLQEERLTRKLEEFMRQLGWKKNEVQH
ncbi:MAG: hypothetical protein ACTSXC_01230 [Candidatus Freyarchaeota archaeon]